ncbi:hypothetical protein RI129_002981 [Pyrocoelia pectoralis]|uniref:Uncharacterized protein n=1 Tax=Pyrocoelia pectoralis TaxID=417401 RepID=A0AAN7VPV2_9COLE
MRSVTIPISTIALIQNQSINMESWCLNIPCLFYILYVLKEKIIAIQIMLLARLKYLDFLQFKLIPALAVLYPNALDPDIPDETIWFQQDGAPPHHGIRVRQYLEIVFENRWISRRGFIQ